MSKRDELDELFHQPVRLELMAELCSSAEGRTFTELREKLSLTDGNLSRHLQSLVQAGAVKLKKSFVNSKPLTCAFVTPRGKDSFLKYLEALEEVLRDAAARATGKERKVGQGVLKPARS